MRSTSRDTSMPGGSRRKQPNVNPMARPNLPRPQPVRPLDLPMPTADIDPNAPLPFEIPNVLFKITVTFLSRDINPGLPAVVVLSTAKPPQLGFFTAVLFGRKFCEWPISAWSDYSTGANHQLGMTFQDGHSLFQGYQLFFTEEKELVRFMDIMRSLKEGKHINAAGSTSTPSRVKSAPSPIPKAPAPGTKAPAPAPRAPNGASKTPALASKPVLASKTPAQIPKVPAPMTPAQVPKAAAPVSKAPAPTSTAPTPVPRASSLAHKTSTPPHKTPAPVSNPPALVPTKTSTNGAALTKGNSAGPAVPQTAAADVHKPQAVRQTTQAAIGSAAKAALVREQALTSITNRVASPARASGSHTTPKVINKPSQTKSQDEKTAKPVQDTLINLDKDDESLADSQHPSEATELLSTLDPPDFSKGPDGDPSPADHVSRKKIVDTARHLFNFFLLSGTGGKTETLAQLNEMAEGVRSGVLEHMIQDARARGFGTKHLEEIRDMVNSVFAALIEAKKKTLHAQNELRVSRLQYTVVELMSMKDNAVQPPSCFFEVPYLPKRGDCPQQANSSSRGRSFSSPKPRTTFDESQAAKSVNAMQWAMGAVESIPNPQALEKETKKTGGATTVQARPGDSGLQSSRWVSDGSKIKHANYFTGPAYERTWSKRSYLEDLAQLDPHAKINAGAEDLMDLYFPMPKDEGMEPGPSEPRPPTHQGDMPPPSPFPSAPDTPTAEMDKLQARMARLSLLSPTGPRFTPANGENKPPTSVEPGQMSGVLGFNQSSGPTKVATDRQTNPVLTPSKARQSQPNSVIVPPPRVASRPAASPVAGQIIRGLRAMNGSPSPIPARTSSLPAVRATQGDQSKATGTGSQQPAAPPPAQPTMRGLGASRHSSGTVLTSAGKFGHHVAGSGWK